MHSTLAVFLAFAVRGAMGRYQAVSPPVGFPVFFSIGSAMALWGLALLAGALPNLACAPTSRRALRHGAVGVCTAAALVGLLSDASDAAQAGMIASLGYMLVFSIDSMYLTHVAKPGGGSKGVYSKVNGDADDAGQSEVEMKTVTPEGATVPSGEELTSALDGDVSSFVTPVKQEMTHESVVPAMALAYLAFIRGLSLGADVKLVSETELEMLVSVAIGQVCCVSYSLSVFLADTKLQLGTQAKFLFAFSLMAPIGIAMGNITLANAENMIIRNISSFVAGVLLFYTTARILPQESRDAAVMMMHKGEDDIARLRRTQLGRLGCLFGGWALMVVLNWPRLKIEGAVPK